MKKADTDEILNKESTDGEAAPAATIIRPQAPFQELLKSEEKQSRESEEDILQNTGAWETERLGVAEKRPVHITERGRLPLSVSIEVAGGGVFRIAEIGDVLPVSCTREFTANGSETVEIRLYAGERPLAKQNRLIKKIKLTGIQKITGGRPVITAEFRIESDGTIRIEAIDEGSLRKCADEIDKSWKPSEDEIYKMVQDAKNHLKEDEKLWERIRLVQRARAGMLHASEALKTEKVSAQQRNSVKKTIKTLQRVLEKKGVADLTEQDEQLIAKFV